MLVALSALSHCESSFDLPKLHSSPHIERFLLNRYSPSLLAVKVLEHRNVRRAKLYYLRDRKPSEYRVQ